MEACDSANKCVVFIVHVYSVVGPLAELLNS